jgi:hypothetical protein
MPNGARASCGWGRFGVESGPTPALWRSAPSTWQYTATAGLDQRAYPPVARRPSQCWPRRFGSSVGAGRRLQEPPDAPFAARAVHAVRRGTRERRRSPCQRHGPVPRPCFAIWRASPTHRPGTGALRTTADTGVPPPAVVRAGRPEGTIGCPTRPRSRRPWPAFAYSVGGRCDPSAAWARANVGGRSGH